MRDLRNYLTNYIAATGGFTFGQFKNDPGDDSGSGILAQMDNDIIYSLYSTILKYRNGGISDTAESENAPDFLDAIEEMIAIQINGVSQWVVSTTYAQDDSILRFGIQFVSMEAGNTGNDPLLKPDKWLPCLEFRDAFAKFQAGTVFPANLYKIHDFRVGTYRQYFPFGDYNVGGNSGKSFEVFGVHLDGTVITGNGTLEAIFDVGGGGEYHLLDVIAPDITGTRTLMDARGRVARAVDAGGGDTEVVGDVQGDTGQGHRHDPLVGGNSFTMSFGGFPVDPGTGFYGGDSIADTTGNPVTDTINGTPRISSETRMKNYSVGVPFVIVINEV